MSTDLAPNKTVYTRNQEDSNSIDKAFPVRWQALTQLNHIPQGTNYPYLPKRSRRPCLKRVYIAQVNRDLSNFKSKLSIKWW